ncbi:MAG: T9SS type A sorting domain-containing protein [Chitinophagaceae bacterium]|nr:T9SS type A sorting domain-containing protein [Chitinophagaceae bacterium]
MKNFIFTALLFLSIKSFSQTTTVDVGNTTSPFDSSFVVQTTGQIDTFNINNHPGAGPYQNGEILICKDASLVYDFQPGTSSNPTFYLEEYATLKILQPMFDFKIYMRANSSVDFNGQDAFVKIKRESSATYVNYNVPNSNIQDSIFISVNYTFSSWPGAQSPCLNSTFIKDKNLVALFSISPIPTSQFINIKGDLNKIASIQINNLLGQTVLKEHKNFSQIDVQQLQKGMYFITFITKEDFTETLKLIKE